MAKMVRRPVGTDLDIIRKEQSERAYATLEKQNLYLPSRPVEERIPSLADVSDLTELSDSQLMDLFRRLTSWASFLAGQVSCAQIDERASQKTLDYSEATALIGNLPAIIVSNPCSNSWYGSRWVMMGRRSRPDCTSVVILYQVSKISRP